MHFVPPALTILLLVSLGTLSGWGGEPAQETIVPSVENTVWSGLHSDGNWYEYHYKPGGALHYKSPSGFWKNGVWEQRNDAITMELNNKFSVYKGRIQGNRMTGTGSNKRGYAWIWVADIVK